MSENKETKGERLDRLFGQSYADLNLNSAQPVEGEKDDNRQMFEFHLRQNVHDIVNGILYPEIAISKILYVFDKINQGEGSQLSVASKDQSELQKPETK